MVHLTRYLAALHFVGVVGLPASVTAEEILVSPELPEDVAPGDPVCLANERDEVGEVPRCVTLVPVTILHIITTLHIGLVESE